MGQHPLEAASTSRLVIVDGVPSAELSSLASMPDGVYVGGIQNAPAQAVSQHLVSCARLCMCKSKKNGESIQLCLHQASTPHITRMPSLHTTCRLSVLASAVHGHCVNRAGLGLAACHHLLFLCLCELVSFHTKGLDVVGCMLAIGWWITALLHLAWWCSCKP